MEESNTTNTTTNPEPTWTTTTALDTSSTVVSSLLTTSFIHSNTTKDPNSDLSSFEEFCGNSPFWDYSLLVDSSYPKFTECFQQVAVVWIPCMVYIALSLPYLIYLFGKPRVPYIRVGWVSVSKTACTVCLLGVTIATIIVRATDDDQDDIPDALYVSEGLKCACFLLHLLISHVERQRGFVASGLSWIFWFTLFILNIIPFYSNIEEDKDESDKFGFAIFIVYAILVLVALIIASFVEPREASYYEDLTKAASIGKPTPEFEVSIPNRLSYWWMTGLVILGFKKTLVEEDVFDLHENDKCEHLMGLYEDSWNNEKTRVGKYNSKIRLRKNHAGYDGAFNGLDEKTPLLGRSISKVDDEEEAGTTKEKSPFKSASVLRALLSDHGFMLFCALMGKAVCDIALFLNPKITEALLDYITFKDNYHEWRGYALAASYLATNALSSVGSNLAIFYTKRSALRMRATLINAIYRKSLTAASIGDDTSKGEISNLMAVDCQRIEDIANFVFLVFSAPAQVAIALYLLYDQLGVAVFAGMAVLFLTIPVNAVIGYFYQKWQKLQMQYKDQRIKLLTEVLSGIKVLKLYAWEQSFQKKVEEIRKGELRIIRNTSYLVAFLMYFFTALPNLVQVTSFAVHIADKDFLDPSVAFVSLQLFNMLTPALTLLPLLIPIIIQVRATAYWVYIEENDYLNPSVAFVSLQLFNMLNLPLNRLSLLFPILIQTVVSIDRISIYLNKSDIKPDVIRMNTNAPNAVEIKNGTFTWTLDQPIPTLRNIDFEVAPGSLVAVVGTVGCGKSSLISAILGEMERLNGVVTLKGSVAYVPQEAWIQNATLRNNITFGKDFHQRTYDKIIDACALRSDLAILPGGDKTEIGEKGINISGGQKQRVSLARAVYSDRDIFLLDDPLSAVDSHVGKHIFKEVIGEKGVLKRKTRILVTHGIQWLPMVDKIFCVSEGEIRESGNYNELMDKDGHFAHFIREYAQDNSDSEDKSDEFGDLPENDESADDSRPQVTDSALSDTSTELAKSPSLRKRRKSATSSKRPPAMRRQSSVRRKSSLWELTTSGKMHGLESSLTAGKAGTRLIEEETGESGQVKAAIYLHYLKQLGLNTCIIAIWLYLLFAGSSVFAGIWLTEWTSDDYLLNISNKDTDKYSDKTDEYLGVYAGASIGQGLFILVFSFISAIKMADAAFNLHKEMLDNVLRSPMSFFDTTPIGRLMNRFSRDVDVLDNILPMSIKQAMNVFGLVVTTITNISYGTPIFLVALLPLTVIYVMIQAVYVPTCRQLRRINAITRSPIYVHFSETLNGAASIRAYKCQDRFIRESMTRVNHNIKFYYASCAANSWLSFRLQWLGNLVIFAAALFAVSSSDIDTSVVGLSVSYATSMTQALEQLVNSISECETNIVSVERLKEYAISPQEASWKLPHQPRPDWPDKGTIVFDNYQTRYRPGLELVLKDLTCTIKGGEKIGIVGRTGAGKSSMTVALFRLIEPAGGKIIIDGEDISLLGLHDLRNKITILPQDPVIFSGTLRMNLDPFDSYSEPQLWDALEHSYLKEFVETLPAGLDYECGEEGSNLSVGQRQLVCLARTLLRKTKILVLDEATAAVDMETDDLIQKTIRSEFKECTVLTIAHRLNTIIDYDRVMVLDKGLIKEFDSPQTLLADPNTIFHGMAKDAGLV